ncbi:MAG: hypothetical protein OSJ68_01600 [Clostridia bacterium]|nr:hypothetical protein [Clostridia bacterium]
MERIFYNKKISIMFVAAMLVLLLLVCMLLTTLTQMASMNQRVKDLDALIKRAKADETAKQELIEYMKTDEYVMKWAEQTGRIPKDDISWVKDNIEGK